MPCSRPWQRWNPGFGAPQASFPGTVHRFLCSLPWSDHSDCERVVGVIVRGAIEGLVANYRRKLQLLGELKQSILQKACSGELTADKEVSNAIDNKEEVA